ncbi:MAG: Crp/Fnr family transcriptional regulator [Oscillospiraceae bacterium]
METFLKNSLPFWGQLTDGERRLLLDTLQLHRYEKGTILYHGSGECTGVQMILHGRARVYINSKDGKEITLYRLLDGDVCMMSAACMIKSLSFSISFETETDSEIAVIPRHVYEKLNSENMFVKNFTLEMVASKFSDVMWLLEQLVFSNMGQRLAGALLEQRALCGSTTLNVTHEQIATDLGTAREVVTRLLKQFQTEELVTLSRGKIHLTNEAALRTLAET